jgi:hypothetical protein
MDTPGDQKKIIISDIGKTVHVGIRVFITSYTRYLRRIIPSYFCL